MATKGQTKTTTAEKAKAKPRTAPAKKATSKTKSKPKTESKSPPADKATSKAKSKPKTESKSPPADKATSKAKSKPKTESKSPPADKAKNKAKTSPTKKDREKLKARDDKPARAKTSQKGKPARTKSGGKPARAKTSQKGKPVKATGQQAGKEPGPETGSKPEEEQTREVSADYPKPPAAESLAGRLRRWFEQEGLLERQIESQGYNFHFKLRFNNRSYQCFQPEQTPDKTVLFTRTKITPDHRSALSVIDGHDREELYWKLNFALVHKAAFALKKDELGVLYEFQLSRVIYEDGLTKHQLLSDLRTLHAANLAGSWHLQRSLGPGGDTFGSREQEEVLRPEMYR